jgi:cyanophycin synthetase
MHKRNIKISQDDLEKFDFTARQLMREALRRGWEVEYSAALPDNSISGVSECRKNGKRIVFRTDHTVLTPILAYYAAENKNLSAALFEKNQIPTPESATVDLSADDASLLAILDKYKKIVVKPLCSNRGRGITIGVDDLAKLKNALDFIKQTNPRDKYALLQKQIIGAKEYRFLVLDGRVIAVANRQPPFVVGDGKKTIRELINELNQDPRRDVGHRSVMTRVKISYVVSTHGPDFLDVVPTKGEVVEVLKTSNLSRGGVAEDFTTKAGEQLKQIAVAAAKSCFLGLAGVDIMTSDIENGDRKNSFVIEVNSAPGLRMHESPSIGDSQHVVSQIFDVLEAKAEIYGGEK